MVLTKWKGSHLETSDQTHVTLIRRLDVAHTADSW